MKRFAALVAAVMWMCAVEAQAARGRRGSAAAAPASTATADPLDTRGAVGMLGRFSLWSAEVPLPGNPTVLSGQSIGASLSTDHYGKFLSFNLLFRLNTMAAPLADGTAMSETSSFTALEVQPELGYTLLNGSPLFLSVGAGVNARVNLLNVDETATRSLTSWTMVSAGGSARARFFLLENLYLNGSLFVGFFRVAGVWTATGVTPLETPPAFYNTGELDNSLLIHGHVQIAWRPLEYLAVTAGAAYRRSQFRAVEREVDDSVREIGDGLESDIQVLAGIELLF